MSKKLIYICDDDEVTLKMQAMFLKDLYEVEIFKYASECVKAIHKSHGEKPDVLILDVEMPFMNGFDVLDEIRGYDIPTIGVTSHNEKAIILQFLSRGVDGYLLKPVDKEALIEGVNKAVQKIEERSVKPTVLIVEDKKEKLLQYKNFLNDSYQVTPLNSAMAALKYLEKNGDKIDVILLDDKMPVYDGPFIARYIETKKLCEFVPIIFLTDETDAEELENTLKLSPDGIIREGSSMEDVKNHIEATLVKRRIQRRAAMEGYLQTPNRDN
ncbi:MAG: response regulator [Eubacterium sp.]|nr:response regulator [Eubacterium sp.]